MQLEAERKSRKAQATRDRIMQAALDLFQTRGYEGTTMRDIAQKARIALGASYYYFKNKQELVLAFYADTQQAAEAHHAEVMKKHPGFTDGMSSMLEYRLALLEPYRPFLSVLSRHVDPEMAISPFSHETAALRRRAIQMIEDFLKGCRKRPSDTITHQLSVAVWLFQIGLVFFWLNDKSPGQRQTRRLLHIGLNLIQLAIRMSNHSLFRPVSRNMKELMEIIEGNLI
jgi:AcrR family transcriptional regulator